MLPMGDYNLRLITLRYNGLFDFESLYAAVISWAKNYGYMWHETVYKHKVPSPRGAEQELTWIMNKKVNDYMKFEIKITIHTWDHKEVEVDIDGKKMLTNARINMNLQGKMTWDWQGRFAKGGKIAKKLGEWYADIFYKKDIWSNYHDPLYYRIWNLHAILKKYFEMQTQKYAYKGYLKED
jgi:hypothetical protein